MNKGHNSLRIAALVLSTQVVNGQGLSDYNMKYMDELEQIWVDLLPSFIPFVSLASYVGGVAALLFIAWRIYGHLAQATPINFYALLRPFVLGFVIFNFASFLNIVNGLLGPISSSTSTMSAQQYADLQEMMEQQQAALEETQEWKIFGGADRSGDIDAYTEAYGSSTALVGDDLIDQLSFQADKSVYVLKSKIRFFFAEMLRLIYQAVIMGLNTIRTFYLLVLVIIGPLIFALSIFPGFDGLISSWAFKYLAVWFWLPLIHIFSYINLKIYEITLNGEFDSVGSTFTDPTNMVHSIFLIVGIVGYMSIPILSGYIFSSGNGGFGLGKAVAALGLFGAAKSASAAAAGGGAAADGAQKVESGAKSAYKYATDKFKG